MSFAPPISRFPRAARLGARLGIAGALAMVGLVAVAGSASAHANIVTGVASCAAPAGTGVTVTWTVANDYNLAETANVTAATGGLTTVTPLSQAVAASGNGSGGDGTEPYVTATVTQTLDSTVAGSASLTVVGTFSDGFVSTNTGVVALPSNCQARVQSIAGHIYQCVNGAPTTIQTDLGTLGATGPQSVEVGFSPLVPVSVMAGSYTMTATNPPGVVLVACSGLSQPSVAGTSATLTVVVPIGGNGVGNFYVQADAPAITIVKTASLTSYSTVGEAITYSYRVTDTGNVTLSAVAVDDAHPGLTGLACPTSTLLPGGAETCTAAYQVTAADLAAGSIVNTATAQGTPPGSSTPVVSPPSSVTIPAVGIDIIKQVCGSSSAAACGAAGAGPWTSSTVVPAGDLAYWRITVSDTGSTAVSGISVTDAAVPSCSGSPANGTLAAGASFTLTCDSVVTASMTNVATVTAGSGPPQSASAQVVEATTAVADVTPTPVPVPVTG